MERSPVTTPIRNSSTNAGIGLIQPRPFRSRLARHCADTGVMSVRSNHLKLVCTFLLIVFSQSLFAATDDVEWKRLIDQATDAQRHGHFDTAERGFQSAMRI